MTPKLSNSPAYRAASLQCERQRLLITVAVLAGLCVFSIVRSSITTIGDDLFTRTATVIVVACAIVAEIGMLLAIRRAEQRGGSPAEWTWRLNTVIEALLPTAVIVILTYSPDYGPYAALVAPVTLLYVVLIMLATLRLRPELCWLSGIVAALGYAAISAWTFRAFPEPAPGDGALVTTYYMMVVVMLLLGGLVGATVARKIRLHLVAALSEAQARRETEVHARDTLLFGLAKLAEYRDTDTGTHLERIAEYCELLAVAMRDDDGAIDEAWIKTLRTASSMHDIGKVGVPDRVLCKPGRLTPEERTVIEQHPTLGAEALAAVRDRGLENDPLIAMSIDIALAHHERWDGTGYPRGLSAEEIQLASRIVSVADVYDALTVRRVYKEPMSHEKARAIILEGRATQFDPAVVDAFERVNDAFDRVRARHAEPQKGNDG